MMQLSMNIVKIGRNEMTLGNHSVDSFDLYCLGVGCMKQCNTCLNLHNWHRVNEFDNETRLALQARMKIVNQEKCQITSGSEYRPLPNGIKMSRGG